MSGPVDIEEMYQKFKKTYIPELKELPEPTKDTPKKERKGPSKSKYATVEERDEARRQNGLRLAAANKARREAEKATLSGSEPETAEPVEK